MQPLTIVTNKLNDFVNVIIIFLRVYFLFFEKFERVYFTNSFMGYFHYFVDVIWH